VRWPEIREVKNPASPAVAFTEDGRTVVEVDEKLKGKARATAIWAAVRLHEQGLAALIGLPLLAFVWDPLKRWARNDPGTALAATTAAGSVVTFAVGFSAPMLFDDAEPRRSAQPSVTVTTTTIAVSTRAPTTASRTPAARRQPTRRPSASPALLDRPDLARTPAPASRSTTRPTRTPAPSAQPRSTRTTEPATPDAIRISGPGSGTAGPSPTPPPASAGAPPGDTAANVPEPAPATAGGRDCLVRVNVSPLLDACALG